MVADRSSSVEFGARTGTAFPAHLFFGKRSFFPSGGVLPRSESFVVAVVAAAAAAANTSFGSSLLFLLSYFLFAPVSSLPAPLFLNLHCFGFLVGSHF